MFPSFVRPSRGVGHGQLLYDLRVLTHAMNHDPDDRGSKKRSDEDLLDRHSLRVAIGRYGNITGR
jgi:hypothetical protein